MAGAGCISGLDRIARLSFARRPPRCSTVERDGALPEERFADLDPFLAFAAKSGHELRAYDDALDFVAGKRDAEKRGAKLDQLFPLGAADPAMQTLLKAPLYPYQAEGALFATRAGRALIGDDMGLGKTIQAIAAMQLLARHFGVSRVLVICPTSLKYQWQSEIQRFTGREGANGARVISGGRAQRQKEYALDDFCKITNYEKLQPDLDLIAQWAPELVIVDEAQRVKNWNTIAARALKRIDSPYAIVLTGTPLENKLEELVSIVQFVDQHRLGPTWKLLYEHQVKDEAGRVTGYARLDKIGETLAPVMIRRRKSEVLRQLPARTDQNLLVPMTEAQMAYHQENADIVAKIVHRWRKTKFLSDMDQRRLTCALQNMRMSCNSTYLLDQETDHGVKADELAALLDDLFADPEAKAVVFSQWTRTHDIVIRRLEARGIGYVSFHGGVPSEKRTALIERFSRRSRLPCVPVHRRRQRRPQSAARLDAREHGFAVEPRGARAAHRAHPSHGPGAAGADHQFRFQRRDRGGHAFGAGVQALAGGRNSRRRRQQHFARRLAADPLHEGRRKCDARDQRGRGRTAFGGDRQPGPRPMARPRKTLARAVEAVAEEQAAAPIETSTAPARVRLRILGRRLRRPARSSSRLSRPPTIPRPKRIPGSSATRTRAREA